MQIEVRKNKTKRLRWRDPKTDLRCSRNLGPISMKKAEQERIQLEDALNNGHPVMSGAPRISKLIDLMYENWAAGRSREYWYNIQHSLLLLQEHAGDRIDLITPLAADRFKSQISKDRKASTVNEKIDHIRIAFNQAKRWGLITENVFETVTRMKQPKSDPAIWENKEIKEMISKLKKRTDRCMVYLAWDGGLRAKEIANFNIIEDYELETGAVFIRNRSGVITKGTREREVCILKPHRADMEKLRDECIKTGMEFPFYCRNNKAVSQRFSNLKKRFKFKNTLHDLRHTCATSMIMGASSRDVQEYIGHSSIKTTEDYYFGRVRAQRLRRLREEAEENGKAENQI